MVMCLTRTNVESDKFINVDSILLLKDFSYYKSLCMRAL